MSQPQKRRDTLNPIVSGILGGDYKQVVICSGAGVSTNANIPDYRSGTGIFAQLDVGNEYPDAKRPEDFFSRSFVDQHPELAENAIVKEFHRDILDAEPTASHQLAKWFHDRGILRRVFTQNIDGLYQKTGLPADKIVEYHGNYADGSIVLYGDSIPYRATEYTTNDLIKDTNTDLLIVMGSTLQVLPFCALPNMVLKNCTRILVDKHPKNAMTNQWSKKPTQDVYGLYSSGAMNTNLKFGKRLVTLRPQWCGRTKYKQQYIFTADCDDWANAIMAIQPL